MFAHSVPLLECSMFNPAAVESTKVFLDKYLQSCGKTLSIFSLSLSLSFPVVRVCPAEVH